MPNFSLWSLPIQGKSLKYCTSSSRVKSPKLSIVEEWSLAMVYCRSRGFLREVCSAFLQHIAMKLSVALIGAKAGTNFLRSSVRSSLRLQYSNDSFWLICLRFARWMIFIDSHTEAAADKVISLLEEKLLAIYRRPYLPQGSVERCLLMLKALLKVHFG